MSLLVLSLCDYSGVWSQPFADAGHRVIRVDMQHPLGEHRVDANIWHIGCDITRFDHPWTPNIVLAAPPCTCFCRPGARWWNDQDASGRTDRDIATFLACLRLCKTAKLFWALENPPGRHLKLMPEIGRHAWQFQPWEYGDPWHKQTYIWGTAVKPAPTNIVTPPPTIRAPSGSTQGVIARMSGSAANERSKTPAGFARAFYEANKPMSLEKSA